MGDLLVTRSGSAGPLSWAGLSAYAADRDAIDERLAHLEAPAFRFSTTDAAGWSWSVFDGSAASRGGEYWFLPLTDGWSPDPDGPLEGGDEVLASALRDSGLPQGLSESTRHSQR